MAAPRLFTPAYVAELTEAGRRALAEEQELAAARAADPTLAHLSDAHAQRCLEVRRLWAAGVHHCGRCGAPLSADDAVTPIDEQLVHADGCPEGPRPDAGVRYRLLVRGEEPNIATYFRSRRTALTWARSIARTRGVEVAVWRCTRAGDGAVAELVRCLVPAPRRPRRCSHCRRWPAMPGDNWCASCDHNADVREGFRDVA